MKKVILSLIEELEKEVKRSCDKNQEEIYNKIVEACKAAKTEATKLKDDNKDGKYVMVIEEYDDEDYIYGVRFKSNILDYKRYYMAHTKELNEEQLARLIHCAFFARWYGIIDLEIMEFISKEQESIIYSKWKDKLPEPNEKFFFDSFHSSIER